LLPFTQETPGVVARSAAVDIDAKLMQRLRDSFDENKSNSSKSSRSPGFTNTLRNAGSFGSENTAALQK